MQQISDQETPQKIIDEVVAGNPKVVEGLQERQRKKLAFW